MFPMHRPARDSNEPCPSAEITLPRGVGYIRKSRRSGKWIYTPEVAEVQEAFRIVDEEGNTNLCDVGKRVGIQHRTLANLLRNPIYSGWRVYDQKRGDEKYPRPDARQADRKKIRRAEDEIIRVKVFEEPAVAQDRFDRVQAIMADKGAKWRRQRIAAEINLGSGLAVCGHCGSRLYASSGRRTVGKHPGYYFCRCNYYLYKRQGLSCVQPSIRKESLDATLVAFAAEHLADPKNIEMLAIRAIAAEAVDPDTAGTRLRDLKQRRERLLDTVERGAVAPEEIAERMKKIRDQITAAERALADRQQRAAVARRTNDYLKLLVKGCLAFRDLTTKSQQRTALRAMFARIAFKGPSIVSFVP